MSSFVISKVNYVRAAGLMYGIEEAKPRPHKWFLDHVRKDFEHAYALNVYSVNEQYDTNNLPDENSYDEDFETYRKKGRDIWINKIEGSKTNVIPWNHFRYMMMNFFSGVMYQIENKYAHRVVCELFCRCILYYLFDEEINDVPHIWSEIDLDALSEIYNSRLKK